MNRLNLLVIPQKCGKINKEHVLENDVPLEAVGYLCQINDIQTNKIS